MNSNGVNPLWFYLVGESSAPVIDSVKSTSSSQLEIKFTPPTSDGGDSIDKYVIEYTSNSTAFASSVEYVTISIWNADAADTQGYFTINYYNSIEYFDTNELPWGASAADVEAALNGFGIFEDIQGTWVHYAIVCNLPVGGGAGTVTYYQNMNGFQSFFYFPSITAYYLYKISVYNSALTLAQIQTIYAQK
jgi:hypothetical protein